MFLSGFPRRNVGGMTNWLIKIVMSHPRVILHIDMNSYFASVEQQANPFLRGKAVGVCAYLSENGCILASSREAKQHGVRTGMRVRDAKRLWPSTIFLQNDPPKYRSTTERIFHILAEYTDRIEPYSIDEAFLDLTGYAKNLAGGEKVGIEINRRIKREVGVWLRASSGVAHTRFFAKLAADTGPKDSVTVLPASEVPRYLETLDLIDIWGIARATKEKLIALGMTTPNEFRTAHPARILSSLGAQGYWLWAALNGHEMHEMSLTEEQPKSIGHSYCLPRKTTDKPYLAAILMKLAEKTGRRMREKTLEARGLYVSWGYAHGGGGGKHMRLPGPLWDSWDVFTSAYRPLAEMPLPDTVSFLAVGVTNFAPPSPQTSLFSAMKEMREKKYALTRALALVNNKWGEFTLQRGVMYGTGHNAPDRIGYRKSLAAPTIL